MAAGALLFADLHLAFAAGAEDEDEKFRNATFYHRKDTHATDRSLVSENSGTSVL